ncbi:hypothetical protein ACFWJ4_29650 [Kitasatospora sp. NPDC127067]|uniref:hypothetical protein n=1 Tax=Kitasatospora sp. NPDC127067 TaxID=3347126 RepID=UPI003664D31E
MSVRTLALPALVVSVVLSLSACDPSSPTAQPADRAPSTTPTPVVSATQAVGSSAVSPVSPLAAPIVPGAQVAATSSPSGTPTVAAGAADLKPASYDRQSGKAVLAVVTDNSKGAPSPSATAAATAAVQTGRLIDSPPSAAAPQGALLAITAVKPAGARKVQVETRPATISELLGQTWANIKAALDPHKIQVTPKVKDLKVSYVPAARRGQRLGLGRAEAGRERHRPAARRLHGFADGLARTRPERCLLLPGHPRHPRSRGGRGRLRPEGARRLAPHCRPDRVHRPDQHHRHPGQGHVHRLRSALVAEGSVALYDALGVKATVRPYLRADVRGTVMVAVDGSGGLYGGLDVDGPRWRGSPSSAPRCSRRTCPSRSTARNGPSWPARATAARTRVPRRPPDRPSVRPSITVKAEFQT